MSKFLGIDIKKLHDGRFQFCITGLICKALEATGMEHCNGLPTTAKVEAPLGTDANGSEAKRDWPNSYASFIGIILYLASNTRPDISFAVHQCDRFTHNTKVSHETDVKSICRYLQGTKDNGLVFNPSKTLVMDCYADADFSGLWGYVGIDIKKLHDGRFQFCITGLICKALEATWMDHCNGFPTPTKVESPLGTDANGSEDKRDCPNSYASVIGMMLYLASNTRP